MSCRKPKERVRDCQVYEMALSGYVEYCSRNGVSVTTASARAYMDDVTRRGLARHPELWKDGLNWFSERAASIAQSDHWRGCRRWARRIPGRRHGSGGWSSGCGSSTTHGGRRRPTGNGRERKYPGAGVSWEWFWFFPSRQVSRKQPGLERLKTAESAQLSE